MKKSEIIYGNVVDTVEIVLSCDLIGSRRSVGDRTVHVNVQTGAVYVSLDQFTSAYFIMYALNDCADVIGEDDRFYINVDWLIEYFDEGESKAHKKRVEYFKSVKEIAQIHSKEAVDELLERNRNHDA